MRGAIGYNMKGHRPGLIVLPFEFTTDGAGAVTDSVGEGYTVAAGPGNHYTFTLTEKYTGVVDGGFHQALGSAQDLKAEIVSDTVNTSTPTITVCALQPVNHVTISGPAVLDADGIHAVMLDNVALDMTANIIAGHAAILAAAPRKVTATFSATWAGGDIVFTGTDVLTGLPVQETIASTPGSTVESVHCYTAVTALAHTILGPGVAGQTVTVGYNDALSVGGYIGNGTPTTGVLAAGIITYEATAASDAESVTPTTPAGAGVDFVFMGNFKNPTAITSQTVRGHFILASYGVRRA